MTIRLQGKTPTHPEWLMSLLISATVGCVVATFLLVTIFYKVLVGLLYPFLAVGLMKLAHSLLWKFQDEPEDPRNLTIQGGVIVGGLLSVTLAYFVSDVIALRDLALAGGSMAFLALISIVVERARSAALLRAANRAMVDVGRARKLADYGEYANAQEELEEALLTSELAHGSHHPQVADIVLALAEVMKGLNRVRAATAMYRRAVDIHNALGEPTVERIAALQLYAEHLQRIGELDQGLVIARRAFFESARIYGRTAPTGRCSLTLSRVQQLLGKTGEAYKSGQDAVLILERSLGRSHPETLRAKGLTANLCVSLGRLAEAERIIRDVLLEMDQSHAEQDSEYLGLLLDLAIVQGHRGADNVDLTVLQKAADVFRSYVGPDYPRSADLVERIAFYLTRGATASQESFYTALMGNQPSAARKLLESDDTLVNNVDVSGWTPLQWAVFFDQRDTVECLLTRGANPEYGRDTGLPALFIASRWRRKWVLAALHRKDADFEITTFDGSRPLHGAVRSLDPLTVDSVMSRGPRLGEPNKRGWTPIHEASYAGSQPLLLELIAKGVDLDFQGGSHRETPLHVAILGGHCSTVESLILNGAETTPQDVEGLTPLELARSLERQDIVDILLAHGGQHKTTPALASVESARA